MVDGMAVVKDAAVLVGGVGVASGAVVGSRPAVVRRSTERQAMIGVAGNPRISCRRITPWGSHPPW